MSHILKFGDAPTSPCGDAASPAGDATPTLGRCGHQPLEMYHLLGRCTSPARNVASLAGNVVSPAGDVSASPKSGICDTADLMIIFQVFMYGYNRTLIISQI